MAKPANPTTCISCHISPRMQRPLWIGLAALGFVVVAVALRLGVPLYRQRAAIQAIEKAGGKVVTRDRGPAWLRRWVRRDLMLGIDVVDVVLLEGETITDENLAHLAGLPRLRFLSLMGSRSTDSGLDVLTGLPGIEVLDLRSTQVTDKGVTRLKGLTELEVLFLDGTRITDAGLAELAEMQHITELYLNGTQVTDTGMESLKSLAQLQQLRVFDTRVTAAGVAHLRRSLPKLIIER